MNTRKPKAGLFKMNHFVMALFILQFYSWKLSAQNINTVAGIGTVSGFSGDGGPATAAEFFSIYAVAVDGNDNIFIADFNNQVVRKVDHLSGIVSTFAGTGGVRGFSGDGGPATNAELAYPKGLATDDSGNVYIADIWNDVVRKVNHVTGYITTVAGIGQNPGFYGDGGPATAAELYNNTGMCVDGAGNLYIADAGNNVIRKVDYVTGIINTVAGMSSVHGYSGDGSLATAAELYDPWSVTLDGSGNLYIADFYNGVIRKVDYSSGVINTVAGIGRVYGYSGNGGPATNAELNAPNGVAVDASGNLYISDDADNVIRVVNQSTGIIENAAGKDTSGYSGDGGPATAAKVYEPYGIALDASGNLFIADTYNNVIREVGSIATVAENLKTSNYVNTFPNPFSGTFTLSVSNPNSYRDEKCTIEIYNLMGQNVLTETRLLADDNLISLSNETNGVYLYRVLKQNGSLVGEGKIILQK